MLISLYFSWSMRIIYKPFFGIVDLDRNLDSWVKTSVSIFSVLIIFAWILFIIIVKKLLKNKLLTPLWINNWQAYSQKLNSSFLQNAWGFSSFFLISSFSWAYLSLTISSSFSLKVVGSIFFVNMSLIIFDFDILSLTRLIIEMVFDEELVCSSSLGYSK